VDVQRLGVLLCVSLAALLVPALASAKEVSLTMDDGVRIDAALLLPDGTPPSGSWPAIMMFHGLAGNHQGLVPLAQTFVAKGYAVFIPDARGHGTSGGFVSLDGPREVADIHTEMEWVAERPEISDTLIAAWGISLGGGAAYNSVAAGQAPFKAIEVVETWSDLYTALYPNNFGKSGAIYGFLQSVPTERIDPGLRSLVPSMISSENLPTLRQFFGTRSSLQFMSAMDVPTFLFQGRRDYVFDVDQAAAAYRRLAGPKRLYYGDFGHAPSTFPGPDLQHLLELQVRWFDRFLKNMPNGVDTEPPVQIASDPWTGKTASFARLPAVKQVSLTSRGRFNLAAKGKVLRTFAPLKKTVEQFGAPVVTVTASTRTQWPHLVAVVTAGNKILTEGGSLTPFGAKSRTVKFRLISDANLLRRGTRLTLYLGATSTVQNIANLLYLKPVPDGSALKVSRVTLTLPVLPKTISR
jgi:alpha-beta hydrolase superfamily lysophospholipase